MVKQHWFSFLGSGRFWLAGPLVFIISILVMAGSVTWIAPGAGKINNIILPLVLFPLIWAGLFFYACLEIKLVRAYSVMAMLVAIQLGLLAAHLL